MILDPIKGDPDKGTVLPPDTECITRPAADPELIQLAIMHPEQGWIATELTRLAAAKLALELQAFSEFKSTTDEDA